MLEEKIKEDKIKYVLEHCPNYDEIVNFAIPEGDMKSQDVLRNYRNYVFDPGEVTVESLEKITHLDEIVKEYTDMGKFYHLVQKTTDGGLFDETDPDNVIDFYTYFDLLYKKYEEQIMEGKIGTKWL